MFYIGFLPESTNNPGANMSTRLGNIKLNSFEENISIPLVFWSVEDYMSQWVEGIERIIKGNNPSCLITAMYDPKLANFIELWALYPLKNLIYVQNHLLFMETLKEPFDIRNPYVHIDEREVQTEEDESISEWQITTKDMKSFLYNRSDG